MYPPIHAMQEMFVTVHFKLGPAAGLQAACGSGRLAKRGDDVPYQI